ncbi:MAG: hypothetical protein AAGA48_08025 [Myxococcota bacterium]
MMWKRVGRVALGFVLVMLALGAVSVALSKSRPATGFEGPPAQEMADRIREAVHLDDWQKTKAIRFTFGGRNQHVWDRERGLSRVEWGKNVVLQRTDRRVGRAWKGGEEVYGKMREKLVEKAWSSFINDTFWLQPFDNLNDSGVTRSVVEIKRVQGLFIEYGSGGVTPGDAYWWELDPETNRPSAWRMWVQIIPIGGLKATWDGWVQLPTGAWISTSHQIGPTRLELTEVSGGTSLASIGFDEDPFDPLVNWN